MRNFRRVAIAAAAAGTLASALVGVSPAGAQEGPGETWPLTVTPTSGPSGTVISVSGGNCGVDEVADVEAGFGLVAYDPEKGVSFEIVVQSSVVPDLEGNWAGEITVPDSADPDVDHYVRAECVIDYSEGEGSAGEYEWVPFDVTAGDPTSPTTTAPEGPETPETPETVAPVATPVVAQPTFTG